MWRTPACWYVCEPDIDEAELASPLPVRGTYDWSVAVFRLERRECYGACPEYRVSLYPDGRVEYEGTEHVGVCGRRAWRVSHEDRERLVGAFRKAQYLTGDLHPRPSPAPDLERKWIRLADLSWLCLADLDWIRSADRTWIS